LKNHMKKVKMQKMTSWFVFRNGRKIN